MTEPARRMPEWLITDLLVVVVSLAIISIWVWVGPSPKWEPIFGRHRIFVDHSAVNVGISLAECL